MREIKFRAWDIVDKVMISVEELMWDYDDNGIHLVHSCGTRWLEDGTGKPNHILNDDFILMQFTGLLDKDGKEIYEGDIVNDEYNHLDNFVMEISPSCFHELAEYGLIDVLKVIGNIYENPELLKSP